VGILVGGTFAHQVSAPPPPIAPSLSRRKSLRFCKNHAFGILAAMACAFWLVQGASGDLRWHEPRKESLRVRLIALTLADPRSSFFSSHEIFVAEQELAPRETRLVKLVYAFLPYQPRLSEEGLDFFTVHELHAVRDPSCDETLSQMTAIWENRARLELRYSSDAPVLNPERRHSPLACYQTDAEDYDRGVHQPPGPGD